MRRIAITVLAAIAVACTCDPARAAQPRCPLDVDVCLRQFEAMKTRPWMGVYVETDSTGRRVVTSVVPGSPAARAGVQPGDALESIGGMKPGEWYASKAGWKAGDVRELVVSRGGRARPLQMVCQPITDELFARIVGEHMIEGHLAYMPDEHDDHGGAH